MMISEMLPFLTDCYPPTHGLEMALAFIENNAAELLPCSLVAGRVFTVVSESEPLKRRRECYAQKNSVELVPHSRSDSSQW
jgi:hypothetical protein